MFHPSNSATGSITPEQIRLVLDVSRMLAVTTELDPLLSRIAEAATALLNCERSSIFLHDAKNQTLWSKVALGVTPGGGEIRVSSQAGIVGYAFSHNEPVHVPDPYADTRFNPEPDRRTGFRTRNLLAVPMVDLDKRPLGVIQAINKVGPHTFSADDLSLLQLLADQAGVAIQRYRLQMAACEIVALRHEMDLARKVQEAMIPKRSPDIPGLVAVGYTTPASVTGGDCFDLWKMPDGRLGIFLGDASGHGLAPTLVVSQARTLVRALSDTTPDPHAVLARINARLATDLENGRFVTAFLGYLTPEGALTWSSAGHAPIFIRTASDQPMQGMDAPVPPLGVLDSWDEDQPQQTQIDRTGSLIVLSDGLFEAANPSGEMYGLSRIHELLETARHLSPQEVMSMLSGAVLAWQEKDEPADDQTAVVVARQV